MFIGVKPILYIVYKSDNYTTRIFLQTESTAYIWESIRNLCIMTYAGTPYYITVDQGTEYTSY